uniref:RTP1_C1 domain-containing protein n=1 Tax=Mesocestoides corti TaxID=53468 RepID=A0A5K3EL03_MESCO
MSNLEKLIVNLRDLLPNAHIDDGDPSRCFRACVERYLKGLDDNADLINALDETEIPEAYVLCCLHLLKSMTQINLPADGDKPLFSVHQTQQLSNCLQFVVCLGIYPLLSPGVSVPLHLRLENADKFQCPRLRDMSNRHKKLFEIAECFDALNRSSIDALHDLVSPNAYLGDYLAVLFQLSYGPAVADVSIDVADIVRVSRMRLRALLARLPRPLAFKELFLFQSGFQKQQPRDPDSARCRSSALKDLIVGVLDVHSSDPRHTSAVASALAHILAAPPQSIGSTNSVDQYYHSLAFQISDVIQTWKSTENRDIILQVSHLVAIDTIHQVCERNLQLGRQLFLDKPLLSKIDKLLVYSQPLERTIPDLHLKAIDVSDVAELLGAVDLHESIVFVCELLDTRHPSQALISLLTRYSNPWFHFYALLNLACHDEDDCQIVAHAPDSPVAKLRLRLQSILVNLLESCNSSFSLFRDWLLLPPLDLTSLKALDSDSSLTRPLRLRPGVVLRPPSLILSTETPIDCPYRVCQAAESTDHSLSMVSARVEAAMQLLKSLSPPLEEGEASERILSNWSTSQNDQEQQPKLPSLLLLSLISDINSHLVEAFAHHPRDEPVCVSLRSEGALDEEALSALLTASLLASAMLEQLDASNLWPSDPSLAVHLLSLTLSRLCMVLESSAADTAMLKMQEESLHLVLAIAAFFVNHMEKGDKVTSEVRDRFAELVPLLHKIEKSFPQSSPSVELARQLRIALCTRGAFSVGSSSPPSPSPPNYPPLVETTQKKPLIEVLSSSGSSPPKPQGDTEETPEETTELSPQLAEIFTQLQDPFIPVRGHGLIELSRLLEAKDPSIKGFEDRIYAALTEQLDNEDSYVYLSAIRGLSAMGNAFTDRLLPLLLARFLTDSLNVEFRLKLGEAIVRVLRELGDVSPKYCNLVVSGLLKASNDPSELIRAASLSNLSEICRFLGDAIQPVVYEVFGAIENSLKHDTAPLVRKSAAYLARSLFVEAPRSNQLGLPRHIPEDLIRDIHRLLRDRLRIERDLEVLEQLEAAMAELDARTRASVFRRPDNVSDLVKEIRILRPFND